MAEASSFLTSARTLRQKAGARLNRPVDAAWLCAFRILFGAMMAVSMLRFIIYGWVERFFVEPKFHFKYLGFSWVEPLGSSGMTVLFWCLVLAALFVSVGFLFRLSALLFALGLAYVQLIDVSTYLNHYYLAALLSFLLAFSPAHRSLSLDSLLRARRTGQDQGTPPTVPFAWLALFRLQIGVVYVFAGLAKCNSDWLLHAQPLRIWLGASTDLPLLGPLFTLDGVPLLMSWAGFLFDTTIVAWLSWSRTRLAAYAAVLIFHALTRLLFPIGMFPFIMSLGALFFFPPDWPRRGFRFVVRLLGKASGSSEATPVTISGAAGASRAARPLGWLALSVMALYCLVQVALPLRFLAYEGNVMWHEQGMRLSWRVMLRAKGGEVRFLVSDRATGRRAHVDPAQYLTDLQLAEMTSQPDLILQMAHRIAEEYRGRGYSEVEVRADSRISLNGRRSAVLVDPKVDLSRVEDSLLAPAWVLEAPKASPHHTRPVL